ncbi:MAG: lipoprotein [Bacilli bacterium]|nr:lipoprotein [Bacilli bacterium]
MKRILLLLIFTVLLTSCSKRDDTLVLITEAGFL